MRSAVFRTPALLKVGCGNVRTGTTTPHVVGLGHAVEAEAGRGEARDPGSYVRRCGSFTLSPSRNSGTSCASPAASSGTRPDWMISVKNACVMRSIPAWMKPVQLRLARCSKKLQLTSTETASPSRTSPVDDQLEPDAHVGVETRSQR